MRVAAAAALALLAALAALAAPARAEEIVPASGVARMVKKLMTTKYGVLKGGNPETDALLNEYGEFLAAAATFAYKPETRFTLVKEENPRHIVRMTGCDGAPVTSMNHGQTSQDKNIRGGYFQVLTSLDEKVDAAVIAVRGTDDGTDVGIDLNILRKKFALSSGAGCGTVHLGFYRQWEAMKDGLVARVANWVMQHGANDGEGHKFKHIFVTGHSLGGAVASVAAAYLADKFPSLADRMSVVTFGAPNTGSRDFVKCFDKLIKHSVRIETKGDPIPHVPLTFQSVGKTKIRFRCDEKFFFNCHKGTAYVKEMSHWYGKKQSVCRLPADAGTSSAAPVSATPAPAVTSGKVVKKTTTGGKKK